MNHRLGSTLLELLMSITVMMVIFCTGGRLFAEAFATVHGAIAREEGSRHISMAVDRWREALNQTHSSEWRIEGVTFFTSRDRVRMDGNLLVFGDSTGNGGAISLPADTGCRFSVETDLEGARFAVMDLSVPCREAGRTRTNSVRIVACGRRQP